MTVFHRCLIKTLLLWEENILYLNLGIPSVTFISPLPAKWNVFNVICVEGSPIDWNQINTHYKVQKHKKI